MCNERRAVSPSAFILTLVILMVVFSFIPPHVEKKVLLPTTPTPVETATPFDEIVWATGPDQPVPITVQYVDYVSLFEQYNPDKDRDGLVDIIGSKLGLDQVWYRHEYDVTDEKAE